MASRQVLLLLAAAIAVAFLPTPASAEVFVVGDDAGWTLKYPANWTDGKTFKVGDALMFMYPAGKHWLVELGIEDFKACNPLGEQLNVWTTGNDYVTLDTAGRRWFVCGTAGHCALGMKLIVDVVDVNAGQVEPAPMPSPSASVSVISGAV